MRGILTPEKQIHCKVVPLSKNGKTNKYEDVPQTLTLLQAEGPKLYRVLAFYECNRVMLLAFSFSDFPLGLPCYDIKSVVIITFHIAYLAHLLYLKPPMITPC